MNWELLDRYLAGGCDSEERDEVDRWLAESVGRRQVLEQIAAALEQTPPEALEVMRRRISRDLDLEDGSRRRETGRYGKADTPRRKEAPPRAVKKASERERKKSPGRGKKKPSKQVAKGKPNRPKKKGR